MGNGFGKNSMLGVYWGLSTCRNSSTSASNVSREHVKFATEKAPDILHGIQPFLFLSNAGNTTAF